MNVKRVLPAPPARAHNRTMTRRTIRARAYAPDPGAPGTPCEMPGCAEPGLYRAPKSRRALRDYWWFCLEHVRQYNATWDYYKGMTPGQIEAQIRADTSWQRPSWPLGRQGRHFEEEILKDPLGLLSGKRGRGTPRRDEAVPAELREPLATLGLAWPLTLAELKTRYKELAKRHHPDANGGDRGAEERLKTINLAYATLRSRLASEPGLAVAG